jgi:pimeloyl-ACP methyl ester carboxylesterase
MTDRTEPYSTLTLKDGRSLGYLDVGPEHGAPVFHFHGHGSSRLEALVLADAAAIAGLRVFAFDRPGIGRSDPKQGDRLLDWPLDIAEAADQLGIARFAVQGMSAGGPYALACAHAFPDRVVACSLVSAVPTPQIARSSGARVRRLMWWIARLFPNYLRKRLMEFRPDGIPSEEAIRARMRRIGQWLGGEDLRLMQDESLLDVLARTMRETSRQASGAGNRSEIERLVKPWGFDVRKIAVPVFVFHGGEDRIMPIDHARKMARALKNCVPTFYPAEGHFSVLVNRSHELMAALAPAPDEPARVAAQ